MSSPRLIAFYLPQYHPIPENDEWWGKGFTEWTNVVKARPLFKGHYQPHLPADLGFYDLRVPEVRQAQADMAREYGIYGFCYYHYWFNGKQLLERPFQEVLESGKPDFPFCLCWANESWKGKWHGLSKGESLIEQIYSGIQDYTDHFYKLLPAFRDPRAIRIGGKPIFLIYSPTQIPFTIQFINLWRNLAHENGLQGLYFIGIDLTGKWDFKKDGFDGSLINDLTLNIQSIKNIKRGIIFQLIKKITKKDFYHYFKKIRGRPEVFSYKEFIQAGSETLNLDINQYASIVPNWDNTPRTIVNGTVLKDSTPDLFQQYLEDTINKTKDHDPDNRIIFIKSWNEWAEGNYLEPDQRFGRGFLEVIKEVQTFHK